MDDKKFKLFFSFTFILLGILRIASNWFQKRIDTTVIALFLIAFIPWFVKYLKSLEAFGIKASFEIPEEKKKEVDKATEKLENKAKRSKRKIAVLENENDIINDIYELSDETTRLVLIRYEIEKELKNLCNKNGIDSFKMNIRYLVNRLQEEKVISNDAANLILDILPILNSAVHPNTINIRPEDFEWVNEKGIKLILYLKSFEQ